LPDPRDYTPDHARVRPLLNEMRRAAGRATALPHRVDWREFSGAADWQHRAVASAAHACAALVQHLERRTTGRLAQPSRLFIDHVARQLQNTAWGGLPSLRPALKAIVRCGIPPERHWPYDASHWRREPDALAFSFQREYRGVRYMRLDDDPDSVKTLDRLRWFLAAGFPVALGFVIFDSLTADADIPYPTASDRVVGSHAVIAVGYDDRRRVRSDKGALLVRNSWGPGWGDHGYGWLPYTYLHTRLALDCWTLVSRSWARSGELLWPGDPPT
jgi:C1A family cysteine protease